MQTTPQHPKPGIVISAPQGGGKTRHADQLRKHYGLKRILDDGFWGAGQSIPADTLVLTHEHDERAITLKAALTALRRSAS